jgi:hypothetical protein
MNIFDAFDRIYVINLPERTDRLRDVMGELARAGIGRTDRRLRIFAGVRPADAGVFPSRGAHGCHMSHLGVLREAMRDGVEKVLILEDDLTVHAAALDVPAAMIAQIGAGDWDFAYPGHVEKFTPSHTGGSEWQYTHAPLVCAHFYAVNGRVLPALITYLEACMLRPAGHPDGGPMHIDGAYSMFRARNPRLVTLIASPSMGGQRSSRSDIYPNRWYDRMTGFRVLAGAARRIRNRFRTLAALASGPYKG